MSALTDVRQGLADLLSSSGGALAGVPVFPERPDVIPVPSIIIGPSEDSYIDFEGAPYGCCRVHLAATYLADVGSNDVKAASIDDAILAMVRAIDDSGEFAAIRVGVGEVGVNGQVVLGASVTTITETAL